MNHLKANAWSVTLGSSIEFIFLALILHLVFVRLHKFQTEYKKDSHRCQLEMMRKNLMPSLKMEISISSDILAIFGALGESWAGLVRISFVL